jgi:hypothetical protein
MSNYPEWKEGVPVANRLLFDLGYGFALLMRAEGFLRGLELGIEGKDLLEALVEFRLSRLREVDAFYAHMDEVAQKIIGGKDEFEGREAKEGGGGGDLAAQ